MQPITKNKSAKTAKTDHPEEYDELVKIWQNRDWDLSDHKINFEANTPLMAVLNNSPCVTKILNLRSQRFEFVSRNTKDILGYDSTDFLENGLPFCNSIIHQDDLPKTWKLLKSVWNAVLAVPPAEQGQFKFNYDFRIIKPCGKEVRVLAQNSVLQSDSKGNITHVLVVYSDISHWKKSEQQIATVVSMADNTCFSVAPECGVAPTQQAPLSKRELEIVKLMAEGFSSKLIADKLFISFHTVNTHRQKIIEKTQTRNTGGLIQYAFSHGLI